jgi:hypothetical protein
MKAASIAVGVRCLGCDAGQFVPRGATHCQDRAIAGCREHVVAGAEVLTNWPERL